MNKSPDFELTLTNDMATMNCTILGKLPPERTGWTCYAINVDVDLLRGGHRNFVVPVMLPDTSTTMDLALSLISQMKILSSHQEEDEQEAENANTLAS